MYNYNLSIKKIKDSQKKLSKEAAESRWLKNYHQQIQPRLLQHYDARVNAFIKRIQEKPEQPKSQRQPKEDANVVPWNFSKSSRSATDKKIRSYTTMGEGEDYQKSIFRSSSYIPLGQHQFREREKSKQLKSKSTVNSILQKRYKEVRKNVLKITERGKILTGKTSHRKIYDDNVSDIPSIPSVVEDNMSMRHSINSEMDNIEKDALEYEKNQEVVQKKNHFKRLANLQVTVNDKRAKNSIYSLLIKEGKIKEKKKTQREEAETDLLKDIFQRNGKNQML